MMKKMNKTSLKSGKKRLLADLDELNKIKMGQEVTYKEWIKHTLHALELFKSGIRYKDIL